jgi:hypothetical protein
VVNAINRTGVNNYSYADNITRPDVKKIYYRLQQVDIDAKSQYSKIAAISIDDIKTGLVIYPNPASNFINNGLIFLICGNILWRISCELIIVFFRINNTLSNIDANTKKGVLI